MATPFIIYDASAGSGKTYRLVKDYLHILLRSKQKESYKQILAVTFTNKAVAEMKARIISYLNSFAFDVDVAENNTMFNDLANDLNLHPEQLKQKAKDVLKSILHNYAFFEVATIDKFTHTVIRTFAYDLKLPMNFEVELDTDALLNEAVDRLIAKAGEDSLLSEVLIDFALEKADDDKSWDIAFDLNKIAKLLLNENERPHLQKLNGKTLEDFKELKELLTTKIQDAEKITKTIGQEVLELMQQNGLDEKSFSGGYLPKHFQKLATGNFNVSFGSAWQEKLINNEALYTKKNSNPIVDEIQPKLIEAFMQSKALIIQLSFLKNFYKNVTPLSVLSAIQNELNILKEEQNLLLISEFNTLISETIKDEPAPFIYERLGEKYKHYFIDEFQDTSVMQWQNLIPLISNKLQTEFVDTESGTLTIVGDAKQSIYRWRGGKATQFISLTEGENPFYVKKNVEKLPTNYRSFDEVIDFNNNFFEHISQFISNVTYQKIYKEGVRQKSNTKKGGQVSFQFTEASNKEEEFEKIPQLVYQKIQELRENGFSYSDICVLTRKREQGIAVAEVLSEEEIPIISSETLLIKQSKAVQCIIAILQLTIQPKNNEVKLQILRYLAEEKLQITDVHVFLHRFVQLEPEEMFEKLPKFTFDLSYFLQLSLYEAVEYCIRTFKLTEKSDAYLQFFLDFVLEYTQSKQLGFAGFLEHWEKKKDKLSITASGSENAVQIMTVHKSKGLEFPVVLVPFANIDIYKEKEPKGWFPIQAEEFNGFEEAYLNLNSSVENYGEIGAHLYHERRAELELDNFNILYVAFTRAEQQLHVITKQETDRNGNENLRNFSGLFINYLKEKGKWNAEQSTYYFGTDASKILQENEVESLVETVKQETFISTAKEDHNLHLMTKQGLLWDTSQEKAIEKGNLMHDILAQINYPSDISFVLDEYLNKGVIDEMQYEKLTESVTQIVSHPEIAPYFQQDNKIYNEKDIISSSGKIMRPDRIVVRPNGNVSIIDYKTGLHAPFYAEQVYEYADTLAEMNFNVTERILLYINEEIEIKYI